MVQTKPWETKMLGYFSILKRGGNWQMWYESFGPESKDDFSSYLCYAVSKDGLKWRKPSLKLNFYDSLNTNILKSGLKENGIHGPFVTIDPNDKVMPYRLLYTAYGPGKIPKLFMAKSGDGLRWFNPKTVLHRQFDTQNVMIPVNGKYEYIVRMWSGGQVMLGKREIGKFITDSSLKILEEPKLLLESDENDGYNNLYNSAFSPLNKNIFLLFPTAYDPQSNQMRIDVYAGAGSGRITKILSSFNDLLNIPEKYNTIYIVPGLIPSKQKGSYWLYFAVGDSKHGSTDGKNLSNYYRIKLRIKLKG
jgi:hypothetical protein